MKNKFLVCKSKDGGVYCDIVISKTFQDGICKNCGRKLMSAKTVITKIHDELRLYSDNDEIFIDVQEILRENNVKLVDAEIRNICSTYFKSAKQTKERLSKADELFILLHKANEDLNYDSRIQIEQGMKA